MGSHGDATEATDKGKFKASVKACFFDGKLRQASMISVFLLPPGTLKGHSYGEGDSDTHSIGPSDLDYQPPAPAHLCRCKEDVLSGT